MYVWWIVNGKKNTHNYLWIKNLDLTSFQLIQKSVTLNSLSIFLRLKRKNYGFSILLLSGGSKEFATTFSSLDPHFTPASVKPSRSSRQFQTDFLYSTYLMGECKNFNSTVDFRSSSDRSTRRASVSCPWCHVASHFLL